MSIENHPNIHAVGLAMDIMESVVNRVRGEAGEQRNNIFNNKAIKDAVIDFVIQLSTLLDGIYTEDVSQNEVDKESNESMSTSFSPFFEAIHFLGGKAGRSGINWSYVTFPTEKRMREFIKKCNTHGFRTRYEDGNDSDGWSVQYHHYQDYQD